MLFYLCKSSHFTIHARKIDCHTTSRGYANKGVFAGTIRRREWWRERWRRLTNTRLTNEATSGNSARQLSSNASKSRGRFNPISRLLLSSSFAFYPQLLSLSPSPPKISLHQDFSDFDPDDVSPSLSDLSTRSGSL